MLVVLVILPDVRFVTVSLDYVTNKVTPKFQLLDFLSKELSILFSEIFL